MEKSRLEASLGEGLGMEIPLPPTATKFMGNWAID